MGLIKGLIFDFDGLILDTEEPSFSAWAQIYTDYGVELDLNRWAGCLGSSEAGFNPVAYLQGMLNQTVDEEMLRNTARINTDRAILELKPLPGILTTLITASQMGLKMAVASSSPRSWVAGHLKRLDLYRFFNFVVCMEDVPEVKPAPDLFQAALFGLGLRSSEAIVFEDSPNGITAARRAGIFTVAIPNLVSSRLDTSHASLVLPRIDAISLPELLHTAETVEVSA